MYLLLTLQMQKWIEYIQKDLNIPATEAYENNMEVLKDPGLDTVCYRITTFSQHGKAYRALRLQLEQDSNIQSYNAFVCV